MVKLYIRQLKSGWFFLFVVSVFMMNIYFCQDYIFSKVSLEHWLIYGNFITTFVNNAFFTFSIYRVKIFQNVIDICAIRLDKDKLANQLFKVGILNILIYFILCYTLISICQFGLIQDIRMLLLYVFITIILFAIYELIYIIVIINKKTCLLFFPFICNLIFHYIVILR